jgi:ABC-type transport system involved in multi-copper enzyme maturation permease subunit
MCGLNSAPGRLLRFLGILVLESFASTAMGMAVGSWVSSAEAGVAIAPALMTIFIVFGGLFVVNVPWYLR